MHLAFDSVFIKVVTILHVFRISKAVDNNGNEITPEVEYEGFISHPKPFKCRIEPRSKELENLVRQRLEEM